jgi:hypothetical protein
VFPTAEVRWFHRGAAPPEIVTWFGQGEREPEAQPARTDSYLRLSDNDALGIKLREGRFEVKRRQQDGEIVRWGDRVAGRVELWRKWSFALAASPGSLDTLLASSRTWLEIHKARSLRKYQVTPDREVQAVPATQFPAQGCGLELTAITVEGDHWWSLAFEAFGDEDRLREWLFLVIEHVLAQAPTPILQPQHSFGYPGWLQEVER